jgi:hypothetical protein
VFGERVGDGVLTIGVDLVVTGEHPLQHRRCARDLLRLRVGQRCAVVDEKRRQVLATEMLALIVAHDDQRVEVRGCDPP